jgi:hypothetical protein
MALTGTPLLVLLVITTLVLPGLVLLGWSRVRGNRWLRVLQRLGFVGLAQLSALMLAAVALNDYGDFFSGWSQPVGAIFGTAPHATLANQGLGKLASFGAPTPPAVVTAARRVVRVPATDRLPRGLTPTRWSTPGQYATRGAVATVRLYGPQSHLTNPLAVYLPPAYFTGNRSLPLVEAITGYPSTYLSLTDRLAMPHELLAGIRAHTVGQFVLVMAPSGLPYPVDSECTNSPSGPFAFTYFDRDVPRQMSVLLGLHPTELGAVGYSTGGYCAVKLAMLDPKRFVAAASMSGYFYAQPGKSSPRMFGNALPVRRLNDLRWRLQHLPSPPTSVLIMTGTQEAGLDGWAENNRFLSEVKAPMHAERFVVSNDFGHSYWTWREEVMPAFVWLSRSLGLTPGAGGTVLAGAAHQPGTHRAVDPARRHTHAHRRPRLTAAGTATCSQRARRVTSGGSGGGRATSR